MSDFETHPPGTRKEIELSRDLVKAIEQLIKQYGEGIVPPSISVPYNALKAYYGKSNQRPSPSGKRDDGEEVGLC